MGRRTERKLRQLAASKKDTRPSTWDDLHRRHYKVLLCVPFLLALLSLASITHLYLTTGDFIHRGISLKGGTSYTFPTDRELDVVGIEDALTAAFPGEEFTVRELQSGGSINALVVETSLRGSEDAFLQELGGVLGAPPKDFTVEEMGSSLGDSFFTDLLKTLAFAFLLMGAVVFYYFRRGVPSFAVIFAAMFDIIITLGIVNLLGVRLSSAGIAAFLMLLGYSIDTDILLTSRVLRRAPGTPIFNAMMDAMKTGLTMTAAGLTAAIVAFMVSTSPIIQQIMLILIIGLIVDVLTTWMQNAGLLRWHLERRAA